MTAAVVPDRAAALASLLGRMDGWMGAAGYGHDHPWRMSIAEGLAETAGEPCARDARLAVVASVNADVCCAVMNVLHLLNNCGVDDLSVHLATDALERAGWLAERALVLAGGNPINEDADGWFFGPVQQQQIEQLAMRGLS